MIRNSRILSNNSLFTWKHFWIFDSFRPFSLPSSNFKKSRIIEFKLCSPPGENKKTNWISPLEVSENFCDSNFLFVHVLFCFWRRLLVVQPDWCVMKKNFSFLRINLIRFSFVWLAAVTFRSYFWSEELSERASSSPSFSIYERIWNSRNFFFFFSIEIVRYLACCLLIVRRKTELKSILPSCNSRFLITLQVFETGLNTKFLKFLKLKIIMPLLLKDSSFQNWLNIKRYWNGVQFVNHVSEF